MNHVNTEILKENQNLKLELKELTSITETRLNSYNKVNKRINEKIPTQKKKILGIGQLSKDTSSFGSKDLIFIKSFVDNLDMSITSSNLHKSSKAEDSTLPNHNTSEVPSNKSQRNTIDPSALVSDSPASNYDSTDESLVCSTYLLPLKKLDGVEPSSRPKTIKSILKSKSTFKTRTLKGIIINEPSSAPARGNKSSLASKTNSAPVGKLKNVKMKDDPLFAMVMKELNELKLQISKKKSSYSRNKNTQQVHTTFDYNDIDWFRKRGTLHAKKAKSFKASKNESSSDLRSKTPTKRVVGVNTFRNAKGAQYLPHSSKYVAPPSIDVVRQWFATIGYGEEFLAKGTLKKSLLPPRWRLLMAQIIQCLDSTAEGTNPHVLADQTKSVSKGLETVLTQPTTEKRASSTAIHEKNKAEAKAALLKAQPSFPNVEELNKLLVKSLQSEFLKMLPAHDFSSSLPTELKDLPSKFAKLSEETLQWELPEEFLSLPAQAKRTQCLLRRRKTQTKQPSPSFSKEELKKMLKLKLLSTWGEHIKKDKVKKVLSSESGKKESTESDSDDEAHVTGSMVESSKIKKLKKFDFVTKEGEHIYLTKE
nr:hypothetical protein [Tanacetum cinerariifolium]